MYLLLSRNNPYLEELNKNPQGQTLQKDFDGMEIDLKNRFKSKELNMKDNYNLSNLTSEISEEGTSHTSSLSFISSKLKTSQIGDIDLKRVKTKQKKIELLKKYIHILDIISSIIIIVSEIFSFVNHWPLL
jgi:hypothetical protein